MRHGAGSRRCPSALGILQHRPPEQRGAGGLGGLLFGCWQSFACTAHGRRLRHGWGRWSPVPRCRAAVRPGSAPACTRVMELAARFIAIPWAAGSRTRAPGAKTQALRGRMGGFGHGFNPWAGLGQLPLGQTSPLVGGIGAAGEDQGAAGLSPRSSWSPRLRLSSWRSQAEL